MPSLAAPPPSATLATNERVQARIAAGAPVLHLGFGEAGLPVLPSVAERLGAAAGANGYGPVAGSPAVREAAAGYFERRGLPTSPDRSPSRARQQGAALCAAHRAAGRRRPAAPVVGELRRAGGAGRQARARRPDRRAGRRRPRPRGPARRARRVARGRPPAGDPRPHPARQPDGHAGAARRSSRRSATWPASTACSSCATRSTATSPTSPRRCSAPPRCCPRAPSSPTG